MRPPPPLPPTVDSVSHPWAPPDVEHTVPPGTRRVNVGCRVSGGQGEGPSLEAILLTGSSGMGMSTMPRVLVLTVGGSDRPIVNAIRQNEPDFVVFLCSGGSAPGASAGTITRRVTTGRITSTCPACGHRWASELRAGPIAGDAGLDGSAYEIVEIPDPDDLDAVLHACRRVQEIVDSRFPGKQAEIIANYSGGTKTMTLGLGLFALLGGKPWELQVNATGRGRADMIRVTAGDTALVQPAAAARTMAARALAERLLAAFEFDAAVATLEEAMRELGPGAARELGALKLEAMVLAAADRFDHAGALDLARQDPDLLRRHGRRLRTLLRARRQLEGSDRWRPGEVPEAELITDLLGSAERRAARGLYDDAVARLYRATELVAQARLARAWGVDTADAGAAAGRLPPRASAWLRTLPVSPSGTVQLGLIRAYELLATLGDPIGEIYRDGREVLVHWIAARNGSLMAHGLIPIDRERWHEVGEPWLSWLRGLVEALVAVARREGDTGRTPGGTGV